MSGCRRLTLLLILCLGLDFGSPFIPGAFRFEMDESLDGLPSHVRQTRSDRPAAPMPVPPIREVSRVRPLIQSRGPAGRPHEEWLVDLRQSHAPASDPPSSPEDH